MTIDDLECLNEVQIKNLMIWIIRGADLSFIDEVFTAQLSGFESDNLIRESNFLAAKNLLC